MNAAKYCLIIAVLACTACGTTPARKTWLLEGEQVAVADFPEWAGKKCAATGLPAPNREFATDQCTGWPETYEDDGSDWAACCIVHDAEYWCGGTEQQRLDADRKLRKCVSGESTAVHSGVMYLGVRLFAHPIWPVPWRWGFGRDYPTFYDDYEDMMNTGSTDESQDAGHD